MRAMSFLAVALAAGCLLVFAGCRGCGCSRQAQDSDAGKEAAKPDSAQASKEHVDSQPTTAEQPATKPVPEGLVEMKPGAVLSTSGNQAAAEGEARAAATNSNVPPATIRATLALKEFQRTHPKLVVKSSEKDAKPPEPAAESKKILPKRDRFVTPDAREKAPGK
jgi:hypothetical protein